MTDKKDKDIRILFVEDLPIDVELAQREIKKEKIPFVFQVVETEEDFRRELEAFHPDIVISDYSMPSFDGISALLITRSEKKNMPFVMLTGSMNEETAVACMKAGADDYVIKEQIKRLPFAVMEAIEKNKTRKEKEIIQRQLEESLQEYRDLINSMNETIWIIDTNGDLLEVNNTAVSFTGYSRKELLAGGLSLIDALHKIEDIVEMAKNMPADKIQFFETTHRIKSGEEIPVEISSSLIRYRGKTAVLSVARDIRDRIRSEVALRESEEKYRLIVENAKEGIEITQNDRVIFCNSRFHEMLGYTMEEIRDIPFNLIFSESGHRDLAGRYKKRQKGEPLSKRYVTTFYKKDRSLIDVEVTYEIIDYHGSPATFAIVRDITAAKKAEAELIAAKERAEESDRLKSAFLANMSHEIRTPMNGILGFTNLLARPQLTGEQKDKYIHIIQKSGKRMLDTVNAIIEISKIETGQVSMQLSDINPYQEIADLCAFFETEAKEKGLLLHFETPPPAKPERIRTDATKFISILSNLIKNAIKYTDEGWVKIGYVRRKDNLDIYVRDSGIGIPKNRQKAIFDRFIQSDISDARALQGSGLGLSIARSYAEMLGGTIELESEEGKGSLFRFSIPCLSKAKEESSEKNDHAPRHKNKSGKKPLTVLVCEDDESAAFYLSIVLEYFKGKTHIAKTGSDAVAFCRDHPEIDVILMDIKLPGMDGYEATRTIREFNKDVIIIAQTAHSFAGEKEKALAAGCNDYISKPIMEEALLEKIRQYIKQ